jgi:osmoprotectant transport system permease protein
LQIIVDVYEFIEKNPERFFDLVWAHLRLSFTALLIALVIYIPLGILFARLRFGGQLVGIFSAVRVIPSLALVFLFYPFLGFGNLPATVALVILAAPALITNTWAGIRGVDASYLEAAAGLGMNRAQVFVQVQAPLAIPVVVAGMRLAAMELVASATLASFVGAKSLGQYILTGISLLDTTYLLAGGIPIVLLVVGTDLVFSLAERILTPARRA